MFDLAVQLGGNVVPKLGVHDKVPQWSCHKPVPTPLPPLLALDLAV